MPSRAMWEHTSANGRPRDASTSGRTCDMGIGSTLRVSWREVPRLEGSPGPDRTSWADREPDRERVGEGLLRPILRLLAPRAARRPSRDRDGAERQPSMILVECAVSHDLSPQCRDRLAAASCSSNSLSGVGNREKLTGSLRLPKYSTYSCVQCIH